MAAGAGRDLDRKGQQFGALGVGDDRAFLALGNHAQELGRERFERLPDHARLPFRCKQSLRRGVHQRHPRIGIDRDHPGGDGFEHGFGEGAAIIDLAVGADQRLRLLVELRGHAVEGTVEKADLVRPGAPFQSEPEVALPDLARRADQIGERLHLPVGEPQREPDRETDQQQADRHQRNVEAQLQHPRAAGQPVIGRHD